MAKKIGIYSTILNFYWYILWKMSNGKFSVSLEGFEAIFAVPEPEDLRSMQHKIEGEGPVMRDILKNLSRDDVFYDIGAQNGIFSILASKVIKDGDVVAFEPHPENVDLMQKNASINDTKITIKQLALSDENNQTEYNSSRDGKSAVNGTLVGNNSETGELMDVRRGDDLISENNLPKPSVIKIDVEGYEYKVLQGLGQVIEDCRIIYIEIHEKLLSDLGTGTDEIYSFLEERGFHIEELYDKSQTAIKAEIRK